MSNFRAIDRETGFLLPPSIDEWLPEKHLARFVVEVIDGLDLSAMVGSYRGSGSASYHPALLLGILVYGYATGVFSSRKLERATYDSVAFRFITANEHPDHDTIATFRRRFLEGVAELLVRVLEVARERGVPCHDGERAPRPGHDRDVSAALSRGDRRAVCAGAGACARDGHAQDGHGGIGRDEDPRQRQPAQRAVLRARRQDRGAIEGRSGRPDGAGRGSGCGRSCGRHVDPR